MKLLLLQKDLESTYNQKFLELPLGDTLSKLMAMGESKRAIKIRTEFKVTKTNIKIYKYKYTNIQKLEI